LRKHLRRSRVRHVDIETRLVATVIARSRTPARLREVADEKHRELLRLSMLREAAYEVDERGMTEVAMAVKMHDLESETLGGKRNAALQAARGIAPDRSRRPGLRRVLLAPARRKVPATIRSGCRQ
jgi:hypothetical protein